MGLLQVIEALSPENTLELDWTAISSGNVPGVKTSRTIDLDDDECFAQRTFCCSLVQIVVDWG